eukprot:TRINITY_DN20052_c0_g1_i1.p1 TRINITY_DN20052_c0_g1~~TRINITY_DN20052_c0_g1_i1.p1  ORF type:complete len:100 (+),score=21.93 TRINITY_DN20052_c0_g1_i1:83-382(+)
MCIRDRVPTQSPGLRAKIATSQPSSPPHLPLPLPPQHSPQPPHHTTTTHCHHRMHSVLQPNSSNHGCDPPTFVSLACFCLLYTSPSPRDRTRSRMPSSA